MDIGSAAANLVWAGMGVGARRRFRSSLRDPIGAQHRLLAGYLRENQDTEIGRRLGFSRILERLRAPGSAGTELDELYDEYQHRVGLSGYDDIEPLVRRVARGEPDVLTRDAVRRLVPSSGSTSSVKLVPCTARLREEFSRAVDAWIGDLFRNQPGLMGGPAYWSITPAVPVEHEAAAVPVGFDHDSEYLGGARRALARRILAVPDEVSLIREPEAFRYLTLLFLARARDLRLISVWHPSFLSRLLDALPQLLDRVIDDIARGTVSMPSSDWPVLGPLRALRRRMRPDAARAAELKRLSGATASGIWPHLALLSCWADGPARAPAADLAARCGVPIQAKGLIATEAVVSIPFTSGHPLAIGSHFFEFLDSSGRARLAHDLHTGGEYGVVVTTGGGLYRYKLGDRVRVEGWIERTPSVRFIGRDDRVSDRFGEKLSDGFVAGVIETLFAGRPEPRFAMLAPEETRIGVAYTLFVEIAETDPGISEAALERELRKNPHYAWCADLGQLRPARVVRVGAGADRLYVEACVARGQRLGNVKPASLDRESGWESRLGGKGGANTPS